MTGSNRILSHDTFPEITWKREPCMHYVLPPGFVGYSDILPGKLLTIIEDIQSFLILRESTQALTGDLLSDIDIDNLQASIESRLHTLREQLVEDDYISECCIIAAYLCTYVLYTNIWEGHIIPSHCSSQLLRLLQKRGAVSKWIGREALLAWLIYIGGSFAPMGVISSEYAILITGTYAKAIESFTISWNALEICLNDFLWSDTFSLRCRVIWEDTGGYHICLNPKGN
jgi:hypothetical protein